MTISESRRDPLRILYSVQNKNRSSCLDKNTDFHFDFSIAVKTFNAQ